MAKKRRTPGKTGLKIIPIDCIPKHSQQRRSTPPKRRTDFSVFMRSPACVSNAAYFAVSSHGSSSGEVRLDNVSANSLHEDRMKEQFLEDTLVKCSGSHRDENLDVPVSEVESVIQDEALDLGSNRDGKRGKNNTLKVSESTQQESPVTDSNCITIMPGSVVWAKTSCQVWWPAEIMEERPTLAGQTCDGHVLVQFYGNQPCAWIDPVKDLSAFEDSFEERSGNPAKDFQDALKKALQRKEQLISHSKSSPQRTVRSDLQDHSCEKRTSSASSKTIDGLKERGRGKRERKRKLHFDEVASPPKSEKKDSPVKDNEVPGPYCSCWFSLWNRSVPLMQISWPFLPKWALLFDYDRD